MQRVIFCGSRTWNRIDVVAKVVEKLDSDAVVIQGDARGADTIAKACAIERGLKVLSFPADWDRHGRSAGFRRNLQMLEEGEANLVVAFIDTNWVSKGTRNMIELAEAKGVQVVRIEMPCEALCTTCHEPYSENGGLGGCSNSFHLCRECVRVDGYARVTCGRCVKKLLDEMHAKPCDTCHEAYDPNKILTCCSNPYHICATCSWTIEHPVKGGFAMWEIEQQCVACEKAFGKHDR